MKENGLNNECHFTSCTTNIFSEDRVGAFCHFSFEEKRYFLSNDYLEISTSSRGTSIKYFSNYDML